MTDIKKIIEDESKKYADEQYPAFDDCEKEVLYRETINDFSAGANFILCHLQHQNRWREVSKDDIWEEPKKGKVLVKVRHKGNINGQEINYVEIHLCLYLGDGNFSDDIRHPFLDQEVVTHWKYIE